MSNPYRSRPGRPPSRPANRPVESSGNSNYSLENPWKPLAPENQNIADNRTTDSSWDDSWNWNVEQQHSETGKILDKSEQTEKLATNQQKIYQNQQPNQFFQQYQQQTDILNQNHQQSNVENQNFSRTNPASWQKTPNYQPVTDPFSNFQQNSWNNQNPIHRQTNPDFSAKNFAYQQNFAENSDQRFVDTNLNVANPRSLQQQQQLAQHHHQQQQQQNLNLQNEGVKPIFPVPNANFPGLVDSKSKNEDLKIQNITGGVQQLNLEEYHQKNEESRSSADNWTFSPDNQYQKSQNYPPKSGFQHQESAGVLTNPGFPPKNIVPEAPPTVSVFNQQSNVNISTQPQKQGNFNQHLEYRSLEAQNSGVLPPSSEFSTKNSDSRPLSADNSTRAQPNYPQQSGFHHQTSQSLSFPSKGSVTSPLTGIHQQLEPSPNVHQINQLKSQTSYHQQSPFYHQESQNSSFSSSHQSFGSENQFSGFTQHSTEPSFYHQEVQNVDLVSKKSVSDNASPISNVNQHSEVPDNNQQTKQYQNYQQQAPFYHQETQNVDFVSKKEVSENVTSMPGVNQHVEVPDNNQQPGQYQNTQNYQQQSTFYHQEAPNFYYTPNKSVSENVAPISGVKQQAVASENIQTPSQYQNQQNYQQQSVFYHQEAQNSGMFQNNTNFSPQNPASEIPTPVSDHQSPDLGSESSRKSLENPTEVDTSNFTASNFQQNHQKLDHQPDAPRSEANWSGYGADQQDGDLRITSPNIPEQSFDKNYYQNQQEPGFKMEDPRFIKSNQLFDGSVSSVSVAKSVSDDSRIGYSNSKTSIENSGAAFEDLPSISSSKSSLVGSNPPFSHSGSVSRDSGPLFDDFSSMSSTKVPVTNVKPKIEGSDPGFINTRSIFNDSIPVSRDPGVIFDNSPSNLSQKSSLPDPKPSLSTPPVVPKESAPTFDNSSTVPSSDHPEFPSSGMTARDSRPSSEESATGNNVPATEPEIFEFASSDRNTFLETGQLTDEVLTRSQTVDDDSEDLSNDIPLIREVPGQSSTSHPLLSRRNDPTGMETDLRTSVSIRSGLDPIQVPSQTRQLPSGRERGDLEESVESRDEDRRRESREGRRNRPTGEESEPEDGGSGEAMRISRRSLREEIGGATAEEESTKRVEKRGERRADKRVEKRRESFEEGDDEESAHSRDEGRERRDKRDRGYYDRDRDRERGRDRERERDYDEEYSYDRRRRDDSEEEHRRRSRPESSRRDFDLRYSRDQFPERARRSDGRRRDGRSGGGSAAGGRGEGGFEDYDPRRDYYDMNDYSRSSRPSSRSSYNDRDYYGRPSNMYNYPYHHQGGYGANPYDFGVNYNANYYAYLENLRRTNPAAYYDWYQKYYGAPQHAQAVSHSNSFPEDRASVHSGRSSVEDRNLSGKPPLSEGSIMEDLRTTSRLTPTKFSTAHVKGSFSVGCLLEVEPSYPADGERAKIDIIRVDSLFSHDLLANQLKNHPGPLVKGVTHKKTIIEYCELKIRKASNEDFNRASYILLYELMILLIQQNGNVVGVDIAGLLLRNQQNYPFKSVPALNGAISTSNSSSRRNSMLSSHYPPPTLPNSSNPSPPPASSASSEGQQQPPSKTLEEVTDEFRKTLLNGLVQEALELAMGAGLWGHALFLGSKLGKRMHASVMLRFAESIPATDPLQTLYQLHSGRVPANLACPTTDWRPHLAMTLSNSPPGGEINRRAICSLADQLLNRGDTYAAHFCLLLVDIFVESANQSSQSQQNQRQSQLSLINQQSMNSNIILIGHHQQVDLKATSFDPNLLDAIFLTEIFEFACSLSQPDFTMPDLQYVKFEVLKTMLDHGFLVKSLAYLEQIATTLIKQPDLYQFWLIEAVFKLADRIQFHDPIFKDSEDTVLPWISQLESVLNSLNSRSSDNPESNLNFNPEVNEEDGKFEGESENTQVQNRWIPDQVQASQQIQPDYEQDYQRIDQYQQQEYWDQNKNTTGTVSDWQTGGGSDWQQNQMIQNQNNQFLLEQPEPEYPQQQPAWNFDAQNQAPVMLSSTGGKQYDPLEELDALDPPSGSFNAAKPSSQTDSKSNQSKANEKKSSGSTGDSWFGGIFSKFTLKPKNQMILPDDSNPSIVWDPVANKWTNKDDNGSNGSSKLPPPPKSNEFFPKTGEIHQNSDQTVQSTDLIDPKSSMPMREDNASPVSSKLGPTTKPPSGNNMFKLQKGRSLRSNYVDLMNPTSKANVQQHQAPMVPMATSSPQFFIPQPVHDMNAPVDFLTSANTVNTDSLTNQAPITSENSSSGSRNRNSTGFPPR